TSVGLVYFKACGHRNAFEVPLYSILVEASPARVVRPIASDGQAGWILLPDAGATFESCFEGDGLHAAFERVLPLYAQLQRDVAPHADAMLASGLEDMRPSVMPERFD